MKPTARPLHPPDEILQQIAAGDCPADLERKTVAHVVQCKDCASQLKKYVQIFSDEITPEEQEFIAGLKTSDPQFREDWLREHLSPESPTPAVLPRALPWWRTWRTWQPIAVTALFLVIGGVSFWVLLPVIQMQKATALVAAVWTDHRPESRFSDVPYAPFVERPVIQGSHQAFAVGLEPSWIKAENAVVEKLGSGDPRWTQLQARLLLMRMEPGDIERAEELLETARKKGMSNPALEIDLANAYFEHEKLLHPALPNLQKTLDILNKVLHEPKLSSEDKKVALFNLALAYEKSNMWDLAVETWDSYLQQDPSGPWADEARRHRDAAKGKFPGMQSRDPGSPESFLEKYFSGTLRPEDPEFYQQKALTDWLPKAMADEQSNYRLATAKLADVLEKKTLIRG